jgi:hypothetical protein
MRSKEPYAYTDEHFTDEVAARLERTVAARRDVLK